MTKVSMSTKLGIPASTVWDTIGGFNALPDWHPAIEKSELEGGGTVRKLHLAGGGGTVVETLTEHDDGRRTYSYTIDDGPLPVADYHATLSVHDDEGGSRVDWESEFEPSGAPEAEARKVIEGVFEAGLDNLKKMFGG